MELGERERRSEPLGLHPLHVGAGPSEPGGCGEGVDLVIKPPAEALEQMGDFVREMHRKSGLIEELDAGLTMADAEQQVLAYIREHCPEGSRPPLAGNTVATDRSFLARDMPDLEAFLHYRIVDVSSIKELSRRWYPRAYYAAPEKRGNHRRSEEHTSELQSH